MIGAENMCAVLLAAGASRRFGDEDKLLVPVAGAPLALHAAMRIAELAPGRRIAVCPDAKGRLAQRLVALGFEIVINADAAAGLSRSLACGIAATARGRESAALVMLADMPFVTVQHLRKLLARFDPLEAPVAASTDGHVAMPPALFARSCFDELQAGVGDRGGKALLEGATLVTAPPGELADIDRPGDLRA